MMLDGVEGDLPWECHDPGAALTGGMGDEATSPRRIVTPVSRNSETLRIKARLAASKAFTNGSIAIGTSVGVSSGSRPRAKVSLMPAAHLLIVL